MESVFSRSNSSNATESDDGEAAAFIAVAVGHLVLVVVPSLVLGTVILTVMLPNKKLRDPSSVLFICITILCMVGPSTYGILIDLSLITDKPVIGECGTHSGEMLWVFFTLGQEQLLGSIALLSIVQYAFIRWGPRSLLTAARSVVSFLVLLFTCLLWSLTNTFTTLFEDSCRIRGSLCEYSGAGQDYLLVHAIVTFMLFTAPVFTLIFLFSALTYRLVKSHTTNNARVVKNVLIIMVMSSVSAIVFRLIPAANGLVMFGYSANHQSTAWAITYSVELSYPIFLLLTMFTHKLVRETIVKNVQVLWQNLKAPRNRVIPM